MRYIYCFSMRPIIIYNSIITKYLRLDGLILYPFILISEKKENTSIITLKHEFIHIEQIKKYGVFYNLFNMNKHMF